jgi:cytoskeletal protein CcmA (bactofilin family)
MFSKQEKDNRNSSPASNGSSSINMISEGTTIQGSIKANNDIRIAGTVDGQAHSEGRLVLTSHGRVHGNILAHDGDLAGSVEGEVHISGTLILRKTAKVRGDIHTKSIVIEEGASFNGSCKMSANPLEGVEGVKTLKPKDSNAQNKSTAATQTA